MIAHDQIIAADKLEEMEARMSLRMARDRPALISAWLLNCDRFDGAAREKLQAIFSECQAKLGTLH